MLYYLVFAQKGKMDKHGQIFEVGLGLGEVRIEIGFGK